MALHSDWLESWCCVVLQMEDNNYPHQRPTVVQSSQIKSQRIKIRIRVETVGQQSQQKKHLIIDSREI